MLQVNPRAVTQTLRVADSSPGAAALADVQGLAERAARTRTLVSGTAQTDVGRQALAAQPLIRNKRVRGVAVFAGSLADVAGQRGADPAADPGRRRDRARARGARRLPRRARADGAHQAARARRAQGRVGRLLQPDPRRLRRRARAAGGDVRRHAAPARAARHGAQAVHRVGVARAAHADLLARRLPRAARGRGARRRDARPVPRPAARPGRSPAQARDRAARPLAAGVRRAGAAAGADRRRPAGARHRGRVHRPR